MDAPLLAQDPHAVGGAGAYLFDFLRMVRIDAATGEEVALGWIDDRGSCFFPAPDFGGGSRKRRRDGDAPAEDEAESSSGVDECSGESRGADAAAAAAKRRKAGGAWGAAAARLEENKYYQVVSKLFLSYGMANLGAVITEVRKVAQGARTRAFQRQGQLLAAAVDRGFVRTNAPRLGARKHGDGLHLSPPQCPYSR
jgi:hypothetical protein